jgi:two-component system chemotaxis response regulator CheB
MIKLLIVDDSALMRRQLVALFEAEGDFTIRVARNGQEAVTENREFEPDVITLDINMPEMDGLTALSIVMEERPVAVIMISSLTDRGALATFEALALGAVDYIAKPGGTISLSIEDIKADVINKVRTAARAKLKTARGLSKRIKAAKETAPTPTPPPSIVRRAVGREGLVIIGVSTGGPRTLEDILPLLPIDFPWPVLIAQHMPAAFTLSFANRMNSICALNVLEVAQPLKIEPGNIYIAKGGADMILANRAGKLMALPKPETAGYLWHPSVELLGRSVLEHCDSSRTIGVLLTGMGHDGADALTEIKRKGGRTIAESEETAVVFGMPAELIKRGGASMVLNADKIANQLMVWAR